MVSPFNFPVLPLRGNNHSLGPLAELQEALRSGNFGKLENEAVDRKSLRQFHRAIKDGDLEAARDLIAKDRTLVGKKNYKTPKDEEIGGMLKHLHHTSHGGDGEKIKELKEWFLGNNWGMAALHVAAASNRKEMSELLRDEGASWFDMDEEGLTPLHVAVEAGSEDVIRLICEKEPTAIAFSSSHKGQTPLHVAAECGRSDAIEAMVSGVLRGSVLVNDGSKPSKGKNCFSALDASGNSVLHHAAMKCGRGAIDALTAANIFEIDGLNRDGKSALHLAVECGNDSAVESLVVAGASVYIENQDRLSVLELANKLADKNPKALQTLQTLTAAQERRSSALSASLSLRSNKPSISFGASGTLSADFVSLPPDSVAASGLSSSSAVPSSNTPSNDNLLETASTLKPVKLPKEAVAAGGSAGGLGGFFGKILSFVKGVVESVVKGVLKRFLSSRDAYMFEDGPVKLTESEASASSEAIEVVGKNVSLKMSDMSDVVIDVIEDYSQDYSSKGGIAGAKDAANVDKSGVENLDSTSVQSVKKSQLLPEARGAATMGSANLNAKNLCNVESSSVKPPSGPKKGAEGQVRQVV